MWFRTVFVGAIVATIAFASIQPCDYADKIYRINGNSIEFPCESTKSIYIATERYKASSVIPLRVQMDTSNDRAIVMMPRLMSGTPITCGEIKLKQHSCYAQVKPYPCWSYQEEGNCNALQNVVDGVVDENVMKRWKVFYGGNVVREQ